MANKLIIINPATKNNPTNNINLLNLKECSIWYNSIVVKVASNVANIVIVKSLTNTHQSLYLS